MFRLTQEEANNSRSQIVTLKRQGNSITQARRNKPSPVFHIAPYARVLFEEQTPERSEGGLRRVTRAGGAGGESPRELSFAPLFFTNKEKRP